MQAMTQPGFPPHGMATGHPGMPHGQPMGGMQHPGSHMVGHPNPGMMQGMHPSVSGPQVTQGQMVTGLPPGAVTTASGGPMPNAHAMAHIGPGQQPMFPQQHMNFAQMPAAQQQIIQQRRQLQMMQQQQAQQHGMPMNIPNMQGLNPAQIAQMKQQGMMPGNMPMHMAANPQNFQQQQAAIMARQHAQQAAIQARHQQQAQQQAQAMQITRSQETSQPPQQHSIPAPQNQPQPQPQPTNQPQPQIKQQNPNPPQIKQDENSQTELGSAQTDGVDEMVPQPNVQQPLHGQLILQLFQFEDRLQSMEKPSQYESWEQFVNYFFSPTGSLRQQVFSHKNKTDKRFQIPHPALARFFFSHFSAGVKKMLMSTFDCRESVQPNGGHHVFSQNASLTYVYGNGIRVTTFGTVLVSFDAMNKIENMYINTTEWSEYIPRALLQYPESPDQNKDVKAKNAKNKQAKVESGVPKPPPTLVGDYGLSNYMVQLLEVSPKSVLLTLLTSV